MLATLATSDVPAPPPRTARQGMVLSMESARRRRSNRVTADDVIRVLVVGEHAIARAGLCRLLDDEAGVTVVGEAASGSAAERMVGVADPDVVLLDAGCWEDDPDATTRALGANAAVLLLTERDGGDGLLTALRAGATGVLPKDSHPDELASAVRTLAGGGALLPPRAVRQLIAELANTTSVPPR